MTKEDQALFAIMALTATIVSQYPDSFSELTLQIIDTSDNGNPATRVGCWNGKAWIRRKF